MKISVVTIAVVLAAVLLSMEASSQEENGFQTIFGNVRSSGGYGAPELSFSNINHQSSLLVGGKGGWIIGHSFVIGGGGYGLVTNNLFSFNDQPVGVDSVRNYRLDMGYGGLLLEYIAFPKKAVHLSFPLLIGAGGAGISRRMDEKVLNRDNEWTVWQYTEGSPFFFIEPGVGVELNMTRFFRLYLGGSYRHVAGTSLLRLNDSHLSDFNLNLSLKFGKF